MDIMYIKWKLESFWIQICYQKMQFYMIFLQKLNFKNFSFNFDEEKKFQLEIFQKFDFTTPQIITS